MHVLNDKIRNNFVKNCARHQGWGQVQLTKYPKYIPSTSTGQVLIFKKYLSTSSTSTHIKFVLKSGWTYRAE